MPCVCCVYGCRTHTQLFLVILHIGMKKDRNTSGTAFDTYPKGHPTRHCCRKRIRFPVQRDQLVEPWTHNPKQEGSIPHGVGGFCLGSRNMNFEFSTSMLDGGPPSNSNI